MQLQTQNNKTVTAAQNVYNEWDISAYVHNKNDKFTAQTAQQRLATLASCNKANSARVQKLAAKHNALIQTASSYSSAVFYFVILANGNAFYCNTFAALKKLLAHS